QDARQRRIAQSAAGLQGVSEMVRPVIRRLGAESACDRHLGHHGRAAASDQAPVDQNDGRSGARSGDGGVHAGAPGADDEHVGSEMHCARFTRDDGARPSIAPVLTFIGRPRSHSTTTPARLTIGLQLATSAATNFRKSSGIPWTTVAPRDTITSWSCASRVVRFNASLSSDTTSPSRFPDRGRPQRHDAASTRPRSAMKKTPNIAASGKRSLLSKLGPGLITGAADDDPSGIATYSQGGAQFAYGMLGRVFFTYPLRVGIKFASARIGRVTGQGLAANIRRHYPAGLLYGIVGLLLVANTINIAADIGAMAAALKL